MGRGPAAPAWAVPPEAIIEPSRRESLRGWFLRPEAEASRLEPADASGLAWSAVGLKVAHPDRPHRLTLTVKEGEPAALGVALIEAGDARPEGARPRVLLDACASGPPALEDGPPLTFSWTVWPGSPENVLVLINRSPEAAVRLGSITLTELDELLGPPKAREPEASAARSLGLYLDGQHPLDRFRRRGRPRRRFLSTANNLVAYLATCGACHRE